MTKVIMYLAESGAVLAFFYLLYVLVLKRETFFNLNRFFLLGILVFSIVFPFMSFDSSPAKIPLLEQQVQEISKFRMSYYDAMARWEFENFREKPLAGGKEYVESEATFNWADFGIKAFLTLYVIGVALCLSRITVGFYRLWRMTVIYPKENVDGLKVVRLPNPVAPFSFLNYVFVHKDTVVSPEFEQILAHEKVHVEQRHSLDLIFVQFLASFLWFNPLIWKLIKSLKATHEYIADEKIMNSGYSLVEYQTMLLSQLISNNSNGLVHNFNLSFIKKRITMMKNNKSGRSGKVKVAMALSVVVLSSVIFIQCNSGIDEQVSHNVEHSSVVDFAHGVDLPVLPETKYKFTGDMEDAVDLTITGNQVMINGKGYGLDEVVPVLKEVTQSERSIMILRVDKDQRMKFVREVMDQLREADRRKLLYLGKNAQGEKVEVALLLPPSKQDMAKYHETPLPDPYELVASGQLKSLKIDLGQNESVETRQKVYDFVMGHVKNSSRDYVVIGDYADEDRFGDYLVNVLDIQEGFKLVYQEKALEIHEKDYLELEKEEFAAIRKEIPMAVHIANNG